MTSLIVQRVGNGFLVVPQGTSEEPMVFITLKELLTYIAMQLADIDKDFNVFEQQIEFVDRRHDV